MSIEITNTTQLAYPAKCIHCGGEIPAYAKHTRATGFGANMPSEWRMHHDCFKRWIDSMPPSLPIIFDSPAPSRDSLPLPDRLAEIEHRLARMEAYFCRSCWSAPHKHGSDLCLYCERQEYADLKSPPDEAGGES